MLEERCHAPLQKLVCAQAKATFMAAAGGTQQALVSGQLAHLSLAPEPGTTNSLVSYPELLTCKSAQGVNSAACLRSAMASFFMPSSKPAGRSTYGEPQRGLRLVGWPPHSFAAGTGQETC